VATRIITFLERIARDLHEESVEFPEGGAWSREEILGYLNTAERLFLQKTGMLKADDTVVSDGSTLLFDRPDNTIDIDRVSFNGKALRRQTSWDLEREDRNWRSNAVGNPSYWHEDHLANNQIEINKVPAAGGNLRFISDYVYDEYDLDGIYENIHLKDTWEVYLRWKVLSLCLAKDSDQQDLPRSKYADQRFRFGIYLARRLLTENPVLSTR
jgi:hypothetical protein